MQEHETWQVLDATKLQTYMRCPRKFFFNYVLGWKSEIPSNHLVFGSAWHMAMEVLLDKGYNSRGLC
jgi:CRISPR/Cas system-associated exonuclease Cas4 (RecB family)